MPMYVINLQGDSGIRVFPKCFCLQNPVYEMHVTLLTFANKIYFSCAHTAEEMNT